MLEIGRQQLVQSTVQGASRERATETEPLPDELGAQGVQLLDVRQSDVVIRAASTGIGQARQSASTKVSGLRSERTGQSGPRSKQVLASAPQSGFCHDRKRPQSDLKNLVGFCMAVGSDASPILKNSLSTRAACADRQRTALGWFQPHAKTLNLGVKVEEQPS